MTGRSAGGRPGYLAEAGSIAWRAVTQVTRAPSHSRREGARRALARRWLWLSMGAALVVAVLMFALDARAISLMPARGTAGLWPLRLFTDLAKSQYVLWTLAAMLVAILLAVARLRGHSRSVLAAFGLRMQYVSLSVLVAVLAAEVLKFVIGRSRPFVGGRADAFLFEHFTQNPAFASLPSGHATTAFALAFAVSAVWPRATAAMAAYAVLICVSRVVLLAHHPSDVVAGAIVGVIGAMLVRYWFAARRLGFAIRSDGTIAPLAGPSWPSLKRVARETFAP
jgi:undecaprenyl-diphosphatase